MRESAVAELQESTRYFAMCGEVRGGRLGFGPVRSVVFRFEDLTELALALGDEPSTVPLPAGQVATEGEWVLAIFEVGLKRRSTATATRVVMQDGRPAVTFEQRDWDRLHAFATARSEQMRIRRSTVPPGEVDAAIPSSSPPRSGPLSGPLSEGPVSSRAFTPSTMTTARALVVDDDAATRLMVVEVLTAAGLAASAVASAEDALAHLRAREADVMILDVQLPCMSGIDLVKEVRKDARLRKLPILLVSGTTTSRDIVEGFASGADDFVVKPFRAPELAARIFSLLLQRTRDRASAPPAV
jgi:two-component system phosphate regulon response regulator PhoB